MSESGEGRGATAAVATEIPSHDELLERARALRPMLLERQEETERNTCPGPETQQAFVDAGFYKVLLPKRYGGYEHGPWTFMSLAIELARGCPSSAWCWALGHGHVFTAASFFSPEAQDEFFADDGYYVAASFGYPRGTAERVDGGYVISGVWPYGSGSPYSNYYMGQTLAPAGSPHGPEGSYLFFVASRSDFEVLSDWGHVLGLRGSGSNSVKIENAFVPDHWVLPGSFAQLGAVDGGTPGSRYHDNWVYAMPQLGYAASYIPALVVGMGYAALDEYERIIRVKPPERMPGFNPSPDEPQVRAEVAEYQKSYGLAVMGVEGAEAILRCVCQDLEVIARRGDYASEEVLRLAMQASLAGRLVWDAVLEHLWRTGGSSVVADGQRMQRYFRDLATNFTAPGQAMRDSVATMYSQLYFEKPTR
jgi:3-hydroxy-9,10-secoandrosta-1,3,5(10)-triene-9,17-dione monooxygenase